jgi:HAD superfamily hydrolase (TIGR01509 family)
VVRAIVFDLDGVLVDAAPWHYEALTKALSVFGFQIGTEEHEQKYNGLPTIEKLRLFSSRHGLPQKLHPLINELKQKYTEDLFRQRCQQSPAITEMLCELKQQGYLLGLASNSRRSTVDLVVEKMGLSRYLDVVLSHEEVGRPKPAPDIYQAAFRALGVTPKQALIVEDSPYGVQSARASGAIVLQVVSADQVNLQNLSQFLQSVSQSNERSATKGLQILIPMAGEGSRFRAAGYDAPKPFIDVKGKPMIQWVIENVRPIDRDYRYLFLCRKQDLEKDARYACLEKLEPGHVTIPVPSLTQGAACTTLLASDALDEDAPLLIANSDQWVDTNISEFLKFCDDTQCDGAILTFPATGPKWSYARTDHDGRVLQVAEKKPISPDATVGIYFFKRAGDYLQAATRMINKDARVNNEFYVCPVYNELIAEGKLVRTFSIQAHQMHGLGTPEDLQIFLAASE